MDGGSSGFRRPFRARPGRRGLPRLEGAEEEGEVGAGAADALLAVDLGVERRWREER